MKKLLVATRNPGKTSEIRQKLAPRGFEVLSLLDSGLDISVVEDEESFSGNAIKKAVAVSRATGGPALADDSGLEVRALGGAPGVWSARYGGEALSDRQRCEKLLAELAEATPENRSARFCSVLAYAEPKKAPVIFEGMLTGSIALALAGDLGFGYDPIFIPEGYDKTLAELGPHIKNRISHRAKALDAFIAWLAANLKIA